jgi:hypothetical protein
MRFPNIDCIHFISTLHNVQETNPALEQHALNGAPMLFNTEVEKTRIK